MKFGTWGESEAVKFLARKGYSIVERNFRCRQGEVDIVAMDGEELVFVEVKTRRNLNFGLPCESITATKIEHLRQATECYISACSPWHHGVRLDVVEILVVEGSVYIHHMENVLG